VKVYNVFPGEPAPGPLNLPPDPFQKNYSLLTLSIVGGKIFFDVVKG